jgi:hypothetical protein
MSPPSFQSRFSLNINATSSLISYSQSASPAIEFYNSDYYAIPNNENANRDNTFLKDIDYSTNPNYPVNRLAIISGNATPAQTPDSNYTMTRVINPRYEGSRVSSADYNFYTAPTNSVSFQNGDTGSWGGDISYGKTATIDKNPIYFAHFKTSKQSREYWGTYTFEIDALIESPRDSIVGESQETSVIKIEGQNNKLLDVSSTFEKTRQVSVNYENRTYSGNSLQIDIDYSNQNQIVPIFQGASEFKLIGGNEPSFTTINISSSYSYPVWTNSQGISGSVILDISNPSLITGSGYFILGGGFINTSSSIGALNQTSSIPLVPGYALMNTYNHAVKYQTTASLVQYGTFTILSATFGLFSQSLGIPQNLNVDPNDINNYYYFNDSSFNKSLLPYENSNLPFLIENGDEIRISYDLTPSSSIPNYQTNNFTVLNVSTGPSSFNGIGFIISTNSNALLGVSNIENLKNKITVYPDPSTLNIPTGEVYNFTIRRKVNNDQSVIVFQSPPANDQGYQTLSGPGYLIPDDFTETQKKNALTLINNLKAKNAFRDDNDTSISILTP